MIKYIAIALSTALLFVALAWTTIAATPTQSSLITILQTPVDYTLPYPGILPDNFFYPFKALRDRVVSFFITDPQKQAKFDLLQADKRLAAGQSLLQEKKQNAELISQTISKGENYFEEAITNIVIAKKEGMVINDFLDTLTKASIKHQQVLYEMSQVTKGQLQQAFLSDIVRMQGFENQVTKLKSP